MLLKYLIMIFQKVLIWISLSDQIVNNFSIGGNFASVTYKSVSISIYKCKNRPTCKSDDEIKSAVDSSSLTIAVTDFFFDITKYDNPLSALIENNYNFPLRSDVLTKKDFLISANEVIDYK